MLTVRTVCATRGEIHAALRLAGAIAPEEVVALSNSINEPATTVSVAEGDRVHRGEVLGQLDVDDLQASLKAALTTGAADTARTLASRYTEQLTQAQAFPQVHQAQAALLQAEQTLAESRSNLNRDRTLLQQGYLPEQNVDEQLVIVDNNQAAVAAAQAALRSAIANQDVNGSPTRGLQASTVAAARADEAAQFSSADQIRREIARATIVSPVDGVIVNRNLNPGEYPAGRQIFTIEAEDRVFAILTASAIQMSQIARDDGVLVQRIGIPGPAFRGTVAAILDATTPGSSNYTIKVLLDNTSGALHAGMPVTGIVALRGVPGMIVPASAFTDDTRTHIITVEHGKVRRATVRELSSDGRYSAVTGLRDGTAVVEEGTDTLDDGAPVMTGHRR